MDVGWTVAMGVHHPEDATVRPAQPPPTAAPPDNTALILAGAAYRTALAAAARSAVDTAALLRLDTEVAASRRRLWAVEDRWIPRLTGALRRIDQGLEEMELADSSRLRWATTGGRGRPAARTRSADVAAAQEDQAEPGDRSRGGEQWRPMRGRERGDG